MTGLGKRMQYWNNLDGKELDFLQEYEVLNGSLEELIANSSTIVAY